MFLRFPGKYNDILIVCHIEIEFIWTKWLIRNIEKNVEECIEFCIWFYNSMESHHARDWRYANTIISIILNPSLVSKEKKNDRNYLSYTCGGSSKISKKKDKIQQRIKHIKILKIRIPGIGKREKKSGIWK